MSMDEFTTAYLEAALWSSMDESTPNGGEPLDKNYSISDIAADSLHKAIADCKAFQAANAADLATLFCNRYSCDEVNGHNLWLTRNHHGSGFWDCQGYTDDAGERLTEAAHNLGEINPTIGDDGLIYLE